MYKRMVLAIAGLAAAFGYGTEISGWSGYGSRVVGQVQDAGRDKIEELKKKLPDLPEKIDRLSASVATAIPGSQTAASYTGTVSRVSDGDTLHVIDGHGRKHKIRMAYIDAPELQQAYGSKSRQTLLEAAQDKQVRVKVFERDRYRREVAQVFLGDTDLNLHQIREGAAWHYQSYAAREQNTVDYVKYAAAHARAKQTKTGLWHGKNP